MSTHQDPDQALLVLSTFPDESVARSLADRLVQEKLAACVSLLPGVQSIYTWKGETQTDFEWLGLIKIQARTYPELEKRLTEWHPYETPEIIALDIARGSEAYLKWLRASLASNISE